MNEDVKRFIEPIRKSLLLDTDYTQLSDAPLTLEKKEEFAIYRQEIRDMTEQNAETLEEVVFPVKPTL